MTKYIPLILVGVLLNAIAQILLKKGMLSIGHFEFHFENFFPIIKKVTNNLYSVSLSGCWCSLVWKSAMLIPF
jgi:uncharacterized protein involved in cysteine biosynthesis